MAFGKRKQTLRLNPLVIIWLILLTGLVLVLVILKLRIIAPPPFPNHSERVGGLKDLPLWQYLITKRRLAENIFHTLPATKRVRLKPDWLHFLIEVEVEEERPIALICGSQCYNLSPQGYIFKTSASPTPALLPISSQLEISDQSMLDRKIADGLSKVFEFSLVKKLPLRRVEILSNRDLKFYLSLPKSTAYFLIDPNENINEQLDKLDKFLGYKQLTDFLSLDLRIPGKVYYK